MGAPLAYFITFTTYGTWLHGRDAGSVDREHNRPGTPFLSANPALERARAEAMRHPPYLLDGPRRDVAVRTIREVADHRGWHLHAVHVRANHVHIVVSATAARPERVMSDLKAWTSRRLRETFAEPPDCDRWTQHGSTRWLNTEASLTAAITYVLDEQGAPMSRYDGRSPQRPNEPDA
ncbi:MAG TPA: transposase [Tepidisphaeraceae bacterium]|jgi:REP element-mobilizing transposase RayT|nr:transposase [Tepidisphaeraceae bacterium]